MNAPSLKVPFLQFNLIVLFKTTAVVSWMLAVWRIWYDYGFAEMMFWGIISVCIVSLVTSMVHLANSV